MDDHFFAPATLMVVISICLMIVAITGVIGAVKESTMLVNVVSKSKGESFPKELFVISHINILTFSISLNHHLVRSLVVSRVQHGTYGRNPRLHDAWSS